MIACLDMDAFFASVEQASNPRLKGLPIAVIGSKERTVVTTCSYEARRLGVKTGMSKYEAKRACPNLLLVVGNNRKYTFISKKIMDYLAALTADVEVYSVDEAFMNLEDLKMPYKDIAYMIKSYIYENFKLTCSIGIGPNKFIAKMASSVSKPDGYCLVDKKDVLSFIDSFELKDLWGIGNRTAKRLKDIGIFNTFDLRAYGRENLRRYFGKNGDYLYEMACGNYEELAKRKKEPIKSIGHSMTLIENYPSIERCYNYLLQISEMVSERARRHNLAGKTLCLYVRYSSLASTVKRYTLPFFTSSTHHIYNTALYLFNKNVDVEKNVRQLGIVLSRIVKGATVYTNIVETEKARKWRDLYRAIDNINNKYGASGINYASVLNCERKGALTISPAWKPDGIRYINVK
ncbi:MAG: DNA polymerase IV [Deferribacterota bacterium]|nr:DNA polymerase IV [Deferribacterota bacterium]